jgi:uncharacterized protein RhaS with RHS repeats
MYYRARYYDPLLMRFIGEDPIELVGGWNSYTYVRGNPITHSDPLGLQSTYGLPWAMPPNSVPNFNPPRTNQPQNCTCTSPREPDPDLAGQMIGGAMLGIGTFAGIAGGMAGASWAGAEAAHMGALGGIAIADGVASGAVAGAVVGGAVGVVVGGGIAVGYYYYATRRREDSCKACCP